MMVIRECSNPQCGFRYPDLESSHTKAYCPKCGSVAPICVEINNTEAPFQLAQPSKNSLNIKVVLDNIRSLYNVGSIFRTSDGFGASELLLCGITPTPKNPRFSKTSLGAEKTLSWSYHLNALHTCKELKESGYSLIALENQEKTTSLYEMDKKDLPDRVALVVGNEVIGVDPHILRLSDMTVSIPMMGYKSSFNVATAFGIAISYLYAASLK